MAKPKRYFQGTLVLARNKQTSCSCVHSFHFFLHLCVSAIEAILKVLSLEEEKAQQHTKKHQKVKGRTTPSWRTQAHLLPRAPSRGALCHRKHFGLMSGGGGSQAEETMSSKGTKW